MARRDWFDDDEFSEDDGDFELEAEYNQNVNDKGIGMNGNYLYDNNYDENNNYVNDKLFQSIQDSVEKMKLLELQAALKKKGLKSSGSKSILRDRILRSLLDEAGLK